ncbi:MAG: hypothetical protein II739_06700, partial [Clostridia bacterium]|nr:hypothetical protein [Clostridia bacterium]
PHAEPSTRQPTEAPTEAPPEATAPPQDPDRTAPPYAGKYSIYVLWQGRVYAAGSAARTSLPAGAQTIAQKEAFLLTGGVIADADLADRIDTEADSEEAHGEESAGQTRLTLLTLPAEVANGRIGVPLANNCRKKSV